jgi:tetratricopeptide (TPR) repeat protein
MSTDLAALTQYSAVQLFLERALAVKPNFAIDNANAPAVARICHGLDGIPLAIELAAARIRSLSPDEIDQRLNQRFRFLTGGLRTALPRQQTLRALIDWSFDTLTESEKSMLCHIAVFSGGWSLESAEKVCAGDSIVKDQTLALLTSLADKSLVIVEEYGVATRYRLLQTVREYAHDRLVEVGRAEALHKRHIAHFLENIESLQGERNSKRWRDYLELEYGNLRAALSWCLTSGLDVEGGLSMAIALASYWYSQGYLSEGHRTLVDLLNLKSSSSFAQLRGRAFNSLGFLASALGDFELARSAYTNAYQLLNEIGDRGGMARSILNMGSLMVSDGDYEGGVARFQESLAIYRETGNYSGMGACLNRLGSSAHAMGDYAKARAYHEESLAVSRQLGDDFGVAAALNSIGHVAIEQEDYASACAYCTESLILRRELTDKRGLTGSLHGLARLALALKEPEPAARIGSAAIHLREEIKLAMGADEESAQREWIADLKALFESKEQFDSAWKQGISVSLAESVDYALKWSSSLDAVR